MTLAGRLLELERLDQKIEQTQKELRGLDAGQALAQMEAEQKEVATRLGQLDGVRDRLRQGELDVKALDKKTKQLDKKLYSGMVTSPAQLQALEVEIAGVKDEKDRLENELLQMLEDVAGLEEGCNQQLQRVEQARQVLVSRKSEITERLGILQEALRIQREERALLVSQLPDHTVAVYGKLRAAKGVAVAEVKGGNCTGCNMNLPDHKLRSMSGDELARCPNCGRIVVARRK